jgi:hypothetical protein
MKYEIVVGAFGRVFLGRSQLEAERYYKVFVKEAKEKSERQDCQPVTLLKDGMVIWKYLAPKRTRGQVTGRSKNQTSP